MRAHVYEDQRTTSGVEPHVYLIWGLPAQYTSLTTQWTVGDFTISTSHLPVSVLARTAYWLPCLAFIRPNLASASLTDPFPQPKGVQFLKPPSSASQLSTFSYWASRWACLFYLWSATQTFPSLVVLTTSIRPWVLLPASRWVVLANTTFLVRFLTMSSKAGQKYPSLHLGQAILQCRVVNIKVVGTWEGQRQSCKKLASRQLVMQTLRPQFRSLHSGSPSTAEAEAGGFLRLDGQTV